MNIGDYADVKRMVGQLGDATLREALTHAEAGQLAVTKQVDIEPRMNANKCK